MIVNVPPDIAQSPYSSCLAKTSRSSKFKIGSQKSSGSQSIREARVPHPSGGTNGQHNSLHLVSISSKFSPGAPNHSLRSTTHCNSFRDSSLDPENCKKNDPFRDHLPTSIVNIYIFTYLFRYITAMAREGVHYILHDGKCLICKKSMWNQDTGPWNRTIGRNVTGSGCVTKLN